jgi:hypothetical protein
VKESLNKSCYLSKKKKKKQAGRQAGKWQTFVCKFAKMQRNCKLPSRPKHVGQSMNARTLIRECSCWKQLQNKGETKIRSGYDLDPGINSM